jgi:hypothetical protein
LDFHVLSLVILAILNPTLKICKPLVGVKNRFYRTDTTVRNLASSRLCVKNPCPAMTTSTTSGQRQRPCRACGKKFDYPVKASAATRHRCKILGN